MKFRESNYLTFPFKVGKKVKESHISWDGKKRIRSINPNSNIGTIVYISHLIHVKWSTGMISVHNPFQLYVIS